MKKLRAQQIIIDTPTEEGEIWFNTKLQTVIKDENYKTVQRVDNTDQLHRKLSDVGLEIRQVKDPVTQQVLNVSGYGAAAIIKMFLYLWMQEDKGGEINEHGDLIIED
jgi:hypothetical protein